MAAAKMKAEPVEVLDIMLPANEMVVKAAAMDVARLATSVGLGASLDDDDLSARRLEGEMLEVSGRVLFEVWRDHTTHDGHDGPITGLRITVLKDG